METILCIILPILLVFLIKTNSTHVPNVHTFNDPHLLYIQSVQQSIHQISKISRNFRHDDVAPFSIVFGAFPPRPKSSINCHKFLSMAAEDLATSLPIHPQSLLKRKIRVNYKARLSAAETEVQTCMDTLPKYAKRIVASRFDNVTKLIATSLSILSQIDGEYEGLEEEVALSGDMDLSEDIENYDEKTNGKANVVVAADGSGDYKTIKEAIKAVPSSSDKRFVIHVKKGVYDEQVVISREKWNVMMYGDGVTATIVKTSKGTRDPGQTPNTATFTVWGKGFIAKDMAFKNTAGPSNGQAVAVFSASDQSVFYRCLIDGYQDTLWTFSNRQFFRECEIRGTIDFIFGNAAVVFQNSNILVKKPAKGQYNVITAQGKDTQGVQSGITIQNCNIRAAENLNGVHTYLGRPWKAYSTTAFIENNIDGIIDPNGWTSMGGKFPSTVTFVEYGNKGAGGSTKKLSTMVDSDGASKFTVKSLINGDHWIPATGVPFKAGL